SQSSRPGQPAGEARYRRGPALPPRAVVRGASTTPATARIPSGHELRPVSGTAERRPMSTPPRLPKPILVVGAYGYRNFGDEAILAGLLRKLGHREMTVVSRSPHETTAMHGVKAVTVKG